MYLEWYVDQIWKYLSYELIFYLEGLNFSVMVIQFYNVFFIKFFIFELKNLMEMGEVSEKKNRINFFSVGQGREWLYCNFYVYFQINFVGILVE